MLPDVLRASTLENPLWQAIGVAITSQRQPSASGIASALHAKLLRVPR